MELKFQLTKDEFARACWMNVKTRLRPKMDTIACAILVICGLWLLFEGEALMGWIALSIAGIFFGILTASRFLFPSVIYNRKIKGRGVYVLDFMHEGIHFKTTNIDSKLSWALYTHALLGSEVILLYHNKNQFTAIPNRAFASSEQRKEFEQLLREKIKNIKTQLMAHAAPAR